MGYTTEDIGKAMSVERENRRGLIEPELVDSSGRERGQIGLELLQLAENCKHLDFITEKLGGILSGILGPERAESGSGNKVQAKDPTCAVAEQLMHVNLYMDVFFRRLDSIINRCQL